MKDWYLHLPTNTGVMGLTYDHEPVYFTIGATASSLVIASSPVLVGQLFLGLTRLSLRVAAFHTRIITAQTALYAPIYGSAGVSIFGTYTQEADWELNRIIETGEQRKSHRDDGFPWLVLIDNLPEYLRHCGTAMDVKLRWLADHGDKVGIQIICGCDGETDVQHLADLNFKQVITHDGGTRYSVLDEIGNPVSFYVPAIERGVPVELPATH